VNLLELEQVHETYLELEQVHETYLELEQVHETYLELEQLPETTLSPGVPGSRHLYLNSDSESTEKR
jgi:hypothetical protein